MSYCPSCGKESEATVKFCAECGHPRRVAKSRRRCYYRLRRLREAVERLT